MDQNVLIGALRVTQFTLVGGKTKTIRSHNVLRQQVEKSQYLFISG